MQRHGTDRQGEDRIGVALYRRDVWLEVLGAERRPNLLHDLAAAILKGLLEATDGFIAEGIIGTDHDDFLVALIASPSSKRMMGLR